MQTSLSKTVAIAITMCSTMLFAQNDNVINPVDSIPKIKDSTLVETKPAPVIPEFDNKDSTQKNDTPKILVTERLSNPKDTLKPVVQDAATTSFRDSATTVQNSATPPAQETSATEPKKKLRTNKILQSYNFSIPIESENWEVKSEKHEWKSTSYELNWTRYKTYESGYTSLFGLGAGYISGDLKDTLFAEKIKFSGLELNMKWGLGFAPVSNNFIVAVHFFCGVNAKLAYGKVDVDGKQINPIAIYADAIIGGDVIVGYQILESFGVIAGLDITTNAVGIGGYSREMTKASKVTQLNYVFSGTNITPHFGIFFAF